MVQVIIICLISFTFGSVVAYFYLRTKSPINVSHLRALWEVERLILGNLNFNEIAQKVTDIILTELGYLRLGYQIVVLGLIDEKRGVLKRVAISKTDGAKKFLSTTPIPFNNIEISLHEENNISIQALNENNIKFTNRVADVLFPAVSADFSDKLQKELGIKCSMVIPIRVSNNNLGILIFSMTKNETSMSMQEKTIIQSFSQAVGISLQNALLYSSLGYTTKQLGIANQKLQELDKLKDDFVSIASHELRTPMTAIRSYAWMALNKPDIPLSEKMKKWLDRTLTSTERLINLVNDMLNVSRIEAGRIDITPKVFNAVELSHDIAEEVSVKASEQGVKIIVTEAKLPAVFADPDKVHQIMLNLVGNALKFTPTGGSITISFLSDGNMLDISIKDSGVGMSKEDLGRLFRKFGRLDSSYTAISTSGGTGLGLYISKSLVELMKGRIWVSSEGLGQGSTFSFSLPVSTSEVVKEADKYAVKASGEAKPLEPVAI